MTRDPALTHRLRLALDEERTALGLAVLLVGGGVMSAKDGDALIQETRDVTDALVEQVAAS